jgi:hypothetical protein
VIVAVAQASLKAGKATAVEVAPKRLLCFKASVTLLREMNERLRGDSGNLGVSKRAARPSLSPLLRESSGPNDFA